MKILNYLALTEFAGKYPQSASALKAWREVVSTAGWKNLAEVRKIYPHADLYKCCTVFNIGGNKYRLIAEIKYSTQIISIHHILTHAEYDKDKWKKGCEA